MIVTILLCHTGAPCMCNAHFICHCLTSRKHADHQSKLLQLLCHALWFGIDAELSAAEQSFMPLSALSGRVWRNVVVMFWHCKSAQWCGSLEKGMLFLFAHKEQLGPVMKAGVKDKGLPFFCIVSVWWGRKSTEISSLGDTFVEKGCSQAALFFMPAMPSDHMLEIASFWFLLILLL